MGIEDRDWYREGAKRRAESATRMPVFSIPPARSKPGNLRRQSSSPLAGILFGAVCISAVLCLPTGSNLVSKPARGPAFQPAPYASVDGAHEAPFPESGTVYVDQRIPQALLTNQVVVTWPSGVGSAYRVLRLRDAQTGFPVATGYLLPGGRVTLPAPPGTYVLWIASGGRWFGNEQLFGSNTGIEFFKSLLLLTRGSNGIMNQTVTLNSPFGNVPMVPASPADF